MKSNNEIRIGTFTDADLSFWTEADEIIQLKDRVDELKKAILILHPRNDVWITPTDEQAAKIERLCK